MHNVTRRVLCCHAPDRMKWQCGGRAKLALCRGRSGSGRRARGQLCGIMRGKPPCVIAASNRRACPIVAARESRNPKYPTAACTRARKFKSPSFVRGNNRPISAARRNARRRESRENNGVCCNTASPAESLSSTSMMKGSETYLRRRACRALTKISTKNKKRHYENRCGVLSAAFMLLPACRNTRSNNLQYRLSASVFLIAGSHAETWRHHPLRFLRRRKRQA